MSVDWSEFRDGDRVRVTFEGTWDGGDMFRFDGSGNLLHQHGYLTHATSAELIERPFTPPAAGKLFRPGIPTEKDCRLYVSLGADGFRMVRDVYGKPRGVGQPDYQWDQETQAWRDSIDVIDGV